MNIKWTKDSKETPAPETSAAPDLSGLTQPAPAVQPTPAPEAATKKIPVPAAFLTPEGQAYTSNLVSEAVKGVFAQLAPVLQSIALTPEKLAEAERLRRAPTDDEVKKIAREAREKQLMMAEEKENRENLLRNQAMCPHKYPTGAWAVNVVRNYPDRQERFICSLCQSFFQSRRWEIGPPDADNPRGRAYIADMHPLYLQVREVLTIKG